MAVIIINAGNQRALDELLAARSKLPDGIYMEVDDGKNLLSCALFRFKNGKDEKIETSLSPAQVIPQLGVEFILFTSQDVGIEELARGFDWGEIVYSLTTVKQFLATRGSTLN